MQNEKVKNETKRPFYENIDKLKSFSYAQLDFVPFLQIKTCDNLTQAQVCNFTKSYTP